MITLETAKNININELVDIRNIKINTKLSKEERIADYIKQIKNPYCYRYGKYKVITIFDEESNSTLKDCLEEYMCELKNTRLKKKIVLE